MISDEKWVYIVGCVLVVVEISTPVPCFLSPATLVAGSASAEAAALQSSSLSPWRLDVVELEYDDLYALDD